MMKRTYLTTVAVVFGLASSAGAIDVLVPNGDFEVRGTYDPVADGVDKYPQYNHGFDADGSGTVEQDEKESWRNWDKRHNGGEGRMWNPGAVGVASQGLVDVGFGGLDASGNADGYVVVLRSRYLLKFLADGGTYGNSSTGANYNTSVTRLDINTNVSTLTVSDPALLTGAYDGGASFRPTEGMTQILHDSTFDSTAKYTLTAAVGRMPDTVAEGGSTNYGSDSTSAGDYPVFWAGYQISLAAGGLQADHSQYGGYVQDGKVIVSDDTQNPAVNTFATATAAYLPNPATQAAMDALAGEKLQVRLHVKADPARLRAGWAAFDNAALTKIVAGDSDENDAVDLNDGSTLVGNFGTSTGMTWGDGDFTGDGGVDLNDGSLLVGNFGVPVTDTDGVNGAAEWTFDAVVVGGLSTTITVDAVSQAFLSTEALDGATLTMGDANVAVPFSAHQNGPGVQVGELLTSNFISGQERILIEAPAPGVYNFEARWNVLGGQEQSTQFAIEFTAIPEPSTMLLLALGSIGLFGTRRSKKVRDMKTLV